jgi:hypothetical protein
VGSRGSAPTGPTVVAGPPRIDVVRYFKPSSRNPWYVRITYPDGRTLHPLDMNPWASEWAAERARDYVTRALRRR